jgi:hypothetical protein
MWRAIAPKWNSMKGGLFFFVGLLGELNFEITQSPNTHKVRKSLTP